MDLSNLKESVANLTLYDIKAGVRKVQNAVMNYTEMEAKVREATNNEPWGASSTLMQEIANGTFNYQTLNEIMPMIYRRFTEKSAEEWRQIYKSLQLLEFLIKHGSERVIDDARSHLTLLKMLRQFHYIDQNGKDQGINVRNRAKELAELLSDVDRIRAERKKARANKGKYTGIGNTTSNVRYGGFGSDSAGFGSGSGSTAGYGGYSGGVYGDGGGFGGEGDYMEGSSSQGGGGGGSGGHGSRSERFEEYDEFDEGEKRPSAASARTGSSSTRAGVKRTTGGSTPSKKTAAAAAAPPKPKAPEVDLFSFDEPAAPSTGALAPASTAAPAAATADDDDFDDFQSAPTASAAPAGGALAGLSGLMSPPASNTFIAAPQPVSAPQQVSLTDMVGISSISPPPPPSSGSRVPAAPAAPNYAAFHSAAPQPAAQPNYYQSVQVQQPGAGGMGKAMGAGTTSVFPQPTMSVFGQAKPAGTASSSSTAAGGMAALRPVASTANSSSGGGGGGGDAFGSLWSSASSGIKKTGAGGGPGPSMGQLAQEKSHAAIWGAPTSSAGTSAPAKPASTSIGNGLDDLLG